MTLVRQSVPDEVDGEELRAHGRQKGWSPALPMAVQALFAYKVGNCVLSRYDPDAFDARYLLLDEVPDFVTSGASIEVAQPLIRFDELPTSRRQPRNHEVWTRT